MAHSCVLYVQEIILKVPVFSSHESLQNFSARIAKFLTAPGSKDESY